MMTYVKILCRMLAIVLIPFALNANVLYVESGDSFGNNTLRDVVSRSMDGDEIRFKVAKVNITVPIEIPKRFLNNGLKINGGSGKTIIDGGGMSRIFTLSGANKIELSNLVIQNGISNAVSLNDNVPEGQEFRLTVANCEFINNSGSCGGAIEFFNTYYGRAYLTVDSCIFKNNNSSEYGGAIYVGIRSSGSISIKNSKFVGNYANDEGGAIFCGRRGSGDWAPVIVDGCRFESNRANCYGALYQLRTIINSTFVNNSAVTNGAVYVKNACGCTFYGNTTTEGASAITSTADGNLLNLTLVKNVGGKCVIYTLYERGSRCFVCNSVIMNNAPAILGHGGAYSMRSDSNGAGVNFYYNTHDCSWVCDGYRAGVAEVDNIYTIRSESVFANVQSDCAVPEVASFGDVQHERFVIRNGGLAARNGVYIWHDENWENMAFSSSIGGDKSKILGEVGEASSKIEEDATGVPIGEPPNRGSCALIGGEFVPTSLSYTVTFVLGECGMHTGGGELTQSVADGTAAVEPSFTAANGWSFTGWSCDFSKVTGDLMVYAQWKRVDGVYSEYANGILWTYTVDDGIAMLCEVENSKNRASIPTNTTGRVVIPSQFGGCTLRTIGRHAFWQCERMTEVEIPETVRTIQTAAFWECNALQNVVIPEGVKSVGYGAFHGCECLVSAVIPKTATLLGNGEHGNPFIGCPKLADLTVCDGNEKYKVANGMILTMDGKTVVVVPGSWVNVVVPDGVEELARSAITGYDVLSSLTLPESLVRITNGIGSCRKLGRLVIPASVSELGGDAFGLLGLETIIEFKGKPPTAIEDVSSSVRSATYSNQHASEWIQVIDQNGYWKGLALVRQEGASARVSVVFDANGGDMPVTMINFELGEKYGSLPTATREHYEFCGWAIRSTAQLGDTLVGNESIVLASVRKLYAVWEKLPTFTVIFNLGEHGVHAGGGDLVQTVELWNAAVAPNVKAVEGWEFIGWSGGDFSRVWNNLVVTAQYKKAEELSEIYSLSPTWNWVSLNVAPTNGAIDAVFAGVTFADEDVIKSSEGSATYYGGKWYGDLTTIKPGVAYMIKVSTPGLQTLTVTGSAAATSVEVVSGWNWIGPMATEAVSLDALTHSGGFTDEDVIKSAEASATYYGGKWYGELKSLKPGVGYKAKFAKGGTLAFSK